ncbi:MAG: formate dehydrogenase accessory protein FdhE [Deltaproteobacteria bacterium]|nr:formate dehydrogenase accessory protein FdhE [Deltaproteobacteria bacterium]
MKNWDFRHERVREVVKKRPAYAELLDFLVRVIETREKASSELTTELPMQVDEKFQKKLEGGLPVLDRESLPLDKEALRRFLEPMLDLLEERKRDEIKKIRSAIADDRIDPVIWVRAALSRAKAEAANNKDLLDEGLVAFLAHHAASALLGRYAQQYDSTLASIVWEQGYCPICGGLPHMADLRGPEGRRFLACGTCNRKWNFPRMTCPFCGNKEQERLGYFWAESEKEYRVDYCTACKKYLKTVDLRERETPLDLEIEDAATFHLDLLAQKKGYQPPVSQSGML